MVYLLAAVIAALCFYCFYPGKKLRAGTVIDHIVVYKGKRRMEVYAQGILIKTYRIALGFSPEGHKQFEGDGKTPEGTYTINARNARSKFHKNLGISYPNAADCAHAAHAGKSPGGDIKIHGLRNGRGYRGRLHRHKNWTAGCIAVTNSEIDELFIAVTANATIEIYP